MASTNEGRWLLRFLEEWAGRAFRRLTEAVESASDETRSRCDLHARGDRHLRVVLETALRRRQMRLLTAFGNSAAINGDDEAPGCEPLPDRMRLAQRRWIKAIRALADDNELDVLRRDWDGSERPTTEIITRAILDDAALAGMINEISNR